MRRVDSRWNTIREAILGERGVAVAWSRSIVSEVECTAISVVESCGIGEEQHAVLQYQSQDTDGTTCNGPVHETIHASVAPKSHEERMRSSSERLSAFDL